MASEVKTNKKSAFSCEPCRHRKVKCSGEQPRCSTCIARNEICEYKLHPTMSYTRRLEARIAELERALVDADVPVPGKPLSTELKPGHNESDPTGDANARFLLPFEAMNIGKKGTPTLLSTTSFFPPPSRELATKRDGSVLSAPLSYLERRQRLKENARTQKGNEIFAETPVCPTIQSARELHRLTKAQGALPRPAFTRDMPVLGPYYSHMLMHALLAHSARWCRGEAHIRALLEPHDDGKVFSRNARTLLYEDLSEGSPSIPTIQTLLLLSAQECGAGNRTQAWLYSGIAFRLVEDMGIRPNTQNDVTYRELSDEDVEIRNRLFWSCYFWDKMISLYLGRSPSLKHSPHSTPQVIVDDSAEDDEWVPHGLVYPAGYEYPPTKAHSTSCFMQMCHLSVIFNQILLHLYNEQPKVSDEAILACFHQQSTELRLFWERLPDFLRIDPMRLPLYAPPSHIVTLNCLFHTFKILLHRPMLFRPMKGKTDTALAIMSLKECLISANSIVIIFNLFLQTFGDSRVILSLAYSLYSAASIFLLKIQADPQVDRKILEMMGFCLSVLDRVKSNTPVICNALDLICRNLSKAGVDPTPMLSALPSDKYANIDGSISGPSGGFTPMNTSGGVISPLEIAKFSSYSLSDIDQDDLDALATLEPMSVQVGALADADDQEYPSNAPSIHEV